MVFTLVWITSDDYYGYVLRAVALSVLFILWVPRKMAPTVVKRYDWGRRAFVASYAIAVAISFSFAPGLNKQVGINIAPLLSWLLLLKWWNCDEHKLTMRGYFILVGLAYLSFVFSRSCVRIGFVSALENSAGGFLLAVILVACHLGWGRLKR